MPEHNLLFYLVNVGPRHFSLDDYHDPSLPMVSLHGLNKKKKPALGHVYFVNVLHLSHL